MRQPKKTRPLQGGHTNPQLTRPQVAVIRIQDQQQPSAVTLPATQATWFSVYWAFVVDLWDGVKKCVEDGAKATKKGITDLWGSTKKAVTTGWKVTKDGTTFAFEKIKWAIEESFVWYERIDSYMIPPEDAWWVMFIRESKIPALKDAVKPNTRIHMRFVWVVVFTLAFWNACSLSVDAYETYEKFPVLVSFQPFAIDVGEIPYPSVALTWASNLKTEFLDLVKQAFYRITETGTGTLAGIKYNLMEISTLIQVLRSLCKPIMSWSAANNLKVPIDPFEKESVHNIHAKQIKDEPELKLLAEKVVPSLQEAGSYCSDMIKYCSWNGEETECEEMLKPMLTESGISCVFNKMPVSVMRREISLQTLINNNTLSDTETKKWLNWNLEDMTFREDNLGKKKLKKDLSDIPLVQKSSKKTSGATFVINVDEQKMSCPQFDSSGPRVAISFPLDDHNHEIEQYVTPPNSLITVKVIPELVMADAGIREVTKEKRECLFADEGKLTYYTKYTQNNCKKECLANFIRKTFNCSLISMPNPKGARLCNFDEITNVLYAEEHISRSSDKCIAKCLPTCNSLSYKTEITTEPLSNQTVESLRRNFNFTSSVIHVSFEEDNVIAKVRSLRYSVSDLIGLIGGLFGTAISASLIDAFRFTFATWFLLPPLMNIAQLLLRSLVWIVLKICCCQGRQNESDAAANTDSTNSENNNVEQNEGSTENPPRNSPEAADTTSDVVLVIEENQVENIFTIRETAGAR